MLHDTDKNLLEVASLPTTSFAEQKILCSYLAMKTNFVCMRNKKKTYNESEPKTVNLHLYRELVFATQGKEREFVQEAVAGQFWGNSEAHCQEDTL